MNTDKLTPQEAALYWEQECTYYIHYQHRGIEKPVKANVDNATMSLLLKDYRVVLHLRPLSDISEEEAKELSAYMSLRPTVREMAKYTNTLREFGIDCDGFIESGKAIDKTKNK